MSPRKKRTPKRKRAESNNKVDDSDEKVVDQGKEEDKPKMVKRKKNPKAKKIGTRPKHRRLAKPTQACQRSSNILRLNVGGREYVTSKSTVQQIPESMLATMFSSPVSSAMLDGAYFIDRDPDLFAYVLEHLRTGTVELPTAVDILRRLAQEADFFMLPTLQYDIRCRLSEVRLEVKLYEAPFNCTSEQCNCGDGSFAHLDAFDEDEIEAMNANCLDELTHPSVECVPHFGAPFATAHVNLQTKVPRSLGEAKIVIEMGSRASPTMDDILQLGGDELRFAEAFGCCGCDGAYRPDGTFNNRTKFKSTKGAIIYFDQGQWRANKEDKTDAFVFFVDSSAMTPPSGKWTSDRGGFCLVQGEDYPRPEETSMKEALRAIRSALCAGSFGLFDIDKHLLEPVADILEDFVQDRETTSRTVCKKVGAYNVGDAYYKKDQRRHFRTCIKLEFAVQNASQCKRRRVE